MWQLYLLPSRGGGRWDNSGQKLDVRNAGLQKDFSGTIQLVTGDYSIMVRHTQCLPTPTSFHKTTATTLTTDENEIQMLQR